MKVSKERAAARQAAYRELFGEYLDQHGWPFQLAWNGATPYWGELRGEFMEHLARRAEGMSLRALGEAIAGTTTPPDWHECERPAWLGALQLLGVEYLGDRDRAKLVATAELLGLQVVLHENGVTW